MPTTKTCLIYVTLCLLAALLPPVAGQGLTEAPPPCEAPAYLTVLSGEKVVSQTTGTINLSVTWNNETHRQRIGVTQGRALGWTERITTCDEAGPLVLQLSENNYQPFLSVSAMVDPRAPSPFQVQATHYEYGVLSFDPNTTAFAITIGDASGTVLLNLGLPEGQEALLRIGFDRNGDGTIDDDEMGPAERVQGPLWTARKSFERLPLQVDYRIELREADHEALLLRQVGTFNLLEGNYPVGTQTTAVPGDRVGAEGTLVARPNGVGEALPGSMFTTNGTRVTADQEVELTLSANPDAVGRSAQGTANDPVGGAGPDRGPSGGGNASSNSSNSTAAAGDNASGGGEVLQESNAVDQSPGGWAQRVLLLLTLALGALSLLGILIKAVL